MGSGTCSKTSYTIAKSNFLSYIGNLFGSRKNELTGFLRSITYTIPEESTWEMNANEKVPKHVLVTVSYQVIHGNVPQLFNDDGTPYKFYGYDKEWDK